MRIYAISGPMDQYLLKFLPLPHNFMKCIRYRPNNGNSIRSLCPEYVFNSFEISSILCLQSRNRGTVRSKWIYHSLFCETVCLSVERMSSTFFKASHCRRLRPVFIATSSTRLLIRYRFLFALLTTRKFLLLFCETT